MTKVMRTLGTEGASATSEIAQLITPHMRILVAIEAIDGRKGDCFVIPTVSQRSATSYPIGP